MNVIEDKGKEIYELAEKNSDLQEAYGKRRPRNNSIV